MINRPHHDPPPAEPIPGGTPSNSLVESGWGGQGPGQRDDAGRGRHWFI